LTVGGPHQRGRAVAQLEAPEPQHPREATGQVVAHRHAEPWTARLPPALLALVAFVEPNAVRDGVGRVEVEQSAQAARAPADEPTVAHLERSARSRFDGPEDGGVSRGEREVRELGLLFDVVAQHEPLRGVARDATRQRRLRAGEVERRPLIEEFLRVYSPNQALVRVATRDTEIGGTRVAEGCPVALNFLSANRDEAVFDDPMRFDEARSPNRHIAFGIGTHICIGQSLARLQARITLDALAALPSFATSAPPRWARWTEYGVTHLPIRWAG
jgi:hypothetical protein